MIVSGIQGAMYQEKKSQVGKVSSNGCDSFGGLVKEATQSAGTSEVRTLHGDDEVIGDVAVCSSIDVVNGKSITVYKPKNFNPDNPIFKIGKYT